jgi:hypothetical protein
MLILPDKWPGPGDDAVAVMLSSGGLITASDITGEEKARLTDRLWAEWDTVPDQPQRPSRRRPAVAASNEDVPQSSNNTVDIAAADRAK